MPLVQALFGSTGFPSYLDVLTFNSDTDWPELAQISLVRGLVFHKIAISFTCRSHIPLSFYVSHCCSVAKSCLTLYDPKVCSTPGFPVLYYFLEFTQTHVHWVSDAIQPSHLLLPPSPPVLSPSQHQGLLFQWVDYSHQVAKVLELQIQHQSFQWISTVQSLNHVQLFVTPWTEACQASLSITNSQSLLKLMSITLVMPSKHLIPEYSGLISFGVDWFDGLAVQGTPASPFGSMNYSVLSLLYGPTLTSIHDSWKNYIFDYMFHICWKTSHFRLFTTAILDFTCFLGKAIIAALLLTQPGPDLICGSCVSCIMQLLGSWSFCFVF